MADPRYKPIQTPSSLWPPRWSRSAPRLHRSRYVLSAWASVTGLHKGLKRPNNKRLWAIDKQCRRTPKLLEKQQLWVSPKNTSSFRSGQHCKFIKRGVFFVRGSIFQGWGVVSKRLQRLRSDGQRRASCDKQGKTASLRLLIFRKAGSNSLPEYLA